MAQASLPAGYTELPYVESTGANQWIYTDYVPEWNHRIVVKFMVKQVGTWNFPGVFCARGTANNDRGYSLQFAQGGSSRPNLPGQLELFTGGWAMQSGYYLDLNTDCEVDVNYSLKKWRIDVGGETSEMSTRDHITFTAGSSLAIFCHHTLGDGKKNPDSVYDLGSGYEVVPVGRYGVTVNRVNAVPRLYGGVADIGCSEYWQESTGFSIIFK